MTAANPGGPGRYLTPAPTGGAGQPLYHFHTHTSFDQVSAAIRAAEFLGATTHHIAGQPTTITVSGPLAEGLFNLLTAAGVELIPHHQEGP